MNATIETSSSAFFCSNASCSHCPTLVQWLARLLLASSARYNRIITAVIIGVSNQAFSFVIFDPTLFFSRSRLSSIANNCFLPRYLTSNTATCFVLVFISATVDPGQWFAMNASCWCGAPTGTRVCLERCPIDR